MASATGARIEVCGDRPRACPDSGGDLRVRRAATIAALQNDESQPVRGGPCEPPVIPG